jgi:hypothetical protein
MPVVRRFACVLAAVVLFAPSGLRVWAADRDAEALSCAIACGHAEAPGAACCPSAGGGKGASLAACASADPQSVAPGAPAPPGILLAADRLAAPEGGSLLDRVRPDVPQSPSPRLPDHVPLLLS